MDSRNNPAVPAPEELQFERAIPLAASGSDALCLLCKQPISGDYFHLEGQRVCPNCKALTDAGQQQPSAASLPRAALYGAGAALAGFLIYALVAIVLNMEIALISILVGYMVGTAVRKGSNGLGGRPQQVLAVALTYFAVTTSYIPVPIYQSVKQPPKTEQTDTEKTPKPAAPTSIGQALLSLAFLAVAAPFLGLSDGVSGVLGIVIIFFGLQRAWHLTGRTDLFFTGPYSPSPAE
jgi:hypothetical protein